MDPDAQLPDADPERTVAAVDLGTHTALLLLARASADGGLEVVEDHAFAARLGARMSPNGELDQEACARTLDVLETFARRVALHGLAPGRVRAVGTAVLRRARDGAAFVERVRERCGLELQVVDAREEARLSWLGAASSGRGAPASALVDAGGGSTEVLGPGGRFVASLELGAAWTTERFGTGDAVGPEVFEDLLAQARGVAATLREGALAPAAAGEAVLVGGGAVNLGCLVAGAEAFDHRLAEGVLVEASDAFAHARRLALLSLEERLDLPIEPDRAAVLPAGLAAIGAVLEALGGPRARCTGRGLRHGVALELLGRA